MARRKNKLRKDILVLLILTTIVVLAWVGFEVYFKLSKPTSPEVPAEILRALDPSFDEEALEEIKKRRFITDKELEGISEKRIVVEEEEASEEPEEATESAVQ